MPISPSQGLKNLAAVGITHVTIAGEKQQLNPQSWDKIIALRSACQQARYRVRRATDTLIIEPVTQRQVATEKLVQCQTCFSAVLAAANNGPRAQYYEEGSENKFYFEGRDTHAPCPFCALTGATRDQVHSVIEGGSSRTPRGPRGKREDS